MSALPPNTTAAKAKLIQRALNEKAGSNLVIDGQFGPRSVTALTVFQSKSNLPVTGIYDAATQALLDPFIAQKYLNLAAIQKAATTLGLDVATVTTVCNVETKGAGFFDNGKCAILFERHKFYAALVTVLPQTTVDNLVAQFPNIVNPQPGGYIGGESEWSRLTQAENVASGMGLAPGLAMRSASWGLFQIMGFNYIQAGFTSVEAFVAAMCDSEANQLDAFVNYVQDENAGGMVIALRKRDWTSFAVQYNGKNQQGYDARMAAAYKALTQ
jgi:peptidoglycan hydrolase-like protein with peptidoglycan-binding domain